MAQQPARPDLAQLAKKLENLYSRQQQAFVRYAALMESVRAALAAGLTEKLPSYEAQEREQSAAGFELERVIAGYFELWEKSCGPSSPFAARVETARRLAEQARVTALEQNRSLQDLLRKGLEHTRAELARLKKHNAAVSAPWRENPEPGFIDVRS
jgi:hypothetical protein